VIDLEANKQNKKAPGSIFYFPGEEGISAYWRRNQSTVAALELSRLLSALRKLTGYLGMNTGSILWEGMKIADGDTSAIVLDPEIIRGKYPVPAVKTDYLVGTAVREAYSKIEWSEKAAGLAWGKVPYMDQALRYKFQLFLSMAEKVYLDMRVGRSILNLYAETARKNDFQKVKVNFLPPPSFEEFLYDWWMTAGKGFKPADAAALSHMKDLPDEMPPVYSRLLNHIQPCSESLFSSAMKKNGILERCEVRSDAFAGIWDFLSKETEEWPVDRLTSGVSPEDQKILQQEKPRIPDTTLKAIESALNEFYDFHSDLIIIAERDENVCPTRTSHLVLPMEEKLDRQLYLRMKTALRTKSRQNKITSRGFKSGVIDQRRLYRASVTGDVFLYKKQAFELDRDVVLLIDASSSMVGPKWKISQRVFYSLYEALKDFNKNTRVFAYSEANNTCLLTELSQKGNLYSVVPRGKTASGEAIIATALMLQKKKRLKKPLIVHITDGASNWGCGVSYAIEYCKIKKIGLMTLGIGANNSTRTLLMDEYGRQVQFVNDLKMLPHQFSKLISAAVQMG
jgi:uncharacterized protein YegL